MSRFSSPTQFLSIKTAEPSIYIPTGTGRAAALRREKAEAKRAAAKKSQLSKEIDDQRLADFLGEGKDVNKAAEFLANAGKAFNDAGKEMGRGNPPSIANLVATAVKALMAVAVIADAVVLPNMNAENIPVSNHPKQVTNTKKGP